MAKLQLIKIISGGQTGADRAALDAALAKGVPHGGWLPKGRKTEDGPLPLRYGMAEMASGDYRKRTEQNVLEGDATLIVSHGPLTGGSLLTERLAKRHGRPCLHIDCLVLSREKRLAKVVSWLQENKVKVLNVAGPRASGDPEIYRVARMLIEEILE